MLLKTESQRFWEKVKKTRTCWLWLGKPNESGYGQFYATSIKGEGNKNGKGKRIYAHRYSYLKAKGTIPKGKILDHHCETPSCVQPKHLQPVTRGQNIQLGWKRKTHCKRGHRFNEQNGKKLCKECMRNNKRAKYRALREAGHSVQYALTHC